MTKVYPSKLRFTNEDSWYYFDIPAYMKLDLSNLDAKTPLTGNEKILIDDGYTKTTTASDIANLAVISANNITSTVINLVSSSYYKVINSDVVDAAISATSKPANPQLTYTIQASDIPTDTADVVDFLCYFTAGGKCSTGTSIINYRYTLNGVDISISDNSISVNVNTYYAIMGLFCSNKINVGDVLGIKFWSNNANNLDYRYCNLYIMPRKWRVLGNEMWQLITLPYPLTGTISGVSYFGTNAPQLSVNDIVMDKTNVVNLGPIFKGQNLDITPTDTNAVALLNNQATPQLLRAALATQYIRKQVFT